MENLSTSGMLLVTIGELPNFDAALKRRDVVPINNIEDEPDRHDG